MTLDELEALLTKTDDDLFEGPAPARKYRAWVRDIHPDKNMGEFDRATTLMAELTRRYEGFVNPKKITITTKKRNYALDPNPIRGDIANLYSAGSVLVKMPRSPKDSDLIKREAAALKRMSDPADNVRHLLPYALKLHESFRHKDAAGGALRQINVIQNLNAPESDEKGWYTLAEVKAVYPDGLEGRDIAWMWRRIYAAAGYAHACGVIHGAIVPEHVMIHPTLHGLMLMDWCYSSVMPEMTGDGAAAVSLQYPLIPAIVPGQRYLYPPEITEKRHPTPATDLYMASATMATLLGPLSPIQMVRFARGCMLSSQSMRPQAAFGLQEEFDSLLLSLYGKRTYVPFTMPPGAN